MSEYVNQLVKGKKGAQAIGVLLIGLGAFLIISLVSHSTLDYPNSSRPAAEGFNWGGRIGAYISYGVFTSMGLAAYVWPLLMLFWGWNRLHYQPLKESDYQAEEVAIFSEHADINADSDGRDALFDEAVRLVCEHQQASTSFLQRRMKVGYSRAARLMDELENAHIVGPAEGAKPRQILIEDLAAAEELT